MAAFVELNFRPDLRTLRQFGFIALAGFGAMALLAFFEAGVFKFGLGAARLPVTIGFGTLAASSALFSLVFPKANLPTFVALSVAAYPIGWVVSYVVLGILFYLVFGVVSVIVRLRGLDPLARAYDRRAEGYWISRASARPKSDYFRQF